MEVVSSKPPSTILFYVVHYIREVCLDCSPPGIRGFIMGNNSKAYKHEYPYPR